LEKCGVLTLQQGFTVLEALTASALLALGLTSAIQLSTLSFSANQASQNLDLASGLAQDLAECWASKRHPVSSNSATPRRSARFQQILPGCFTELGNSAPFLFPKLHPAPCKN
jgi:Tfp pilus assembly protein PilV